MGNRLRTALLLGGMTALIVMTGRFLGGRQGMTIALLIALGMNFFSYWFADKIVLRMAGAREVRAADAPDLHRLVQDLAGRAGLPMPKVYLIAQEAPNAFATGRDPAHAAVALTEGLLRLMDRGELAGVLAHELAHVKNRDILIGSIAATLAGAVMLLADMARFSAFFGAGRRQEEGGGGGMLGAILVSILAPLAAMLIQMAISRSREYLADSTGAAIAGGPGGLAGALEKLGRAVPRLPLEASPATAHIYTVSPLAGGGLMGLFSTHPPIAERIACLRGRRGVRPPFDAPTPPPGTSDEDALARQGRAFWERLK
jgi:heat shock protein HtpX